LRQRHQNPGHVVNSWLDHKKMLSYLPNILANPSSKSVKLQYSKDLREMDSFQFLYSQNCVILHEIAFKLDLTFDQIFYRDYGARDFNSLRFTWTDLPFSDNFPGRNFCMFHNTTLWWQKSTIGGASEESVFYATVHIPN
jgi:hypothetical protein